MKHLLQFAAVAIGLVVGITSLPQLGFAADATGQTKWPECFCTDRYGKRHEIGDIICLTVDGRSYEAKCVMAQNNPFWRDLSRPCLSAALPSWLDPAPTMSKASPKIAALYQ